MTEQGPWTQPMPDEQFQRMRDILAAPSPIGLEAAMTEGVIVPQLTGVIPPTWALHRYRGNAGLVIDTHPGRDDLFTVMVIGHADKIRLQVRSIGEDGKVWVDSDSFLPQTLLGHEVTIYSEDPERPGTYRAIKPATIEALGAIHFADAATRAGDKGVRPTQLYLELHLHGEARRKQVESLGIKPGDSVLLDRPIRHGFAPDTFYGAYLDNGLGCFVAAELARVLAAGPDLQRVRVLFAFAAWEEIGRFGSRVLAGEHRPDAIIAVDVNHDYHAAPGVGDRRYTPLEMGKGFTLSVGAIASEQLNGLIQRAARERGVPVQRCVNGRDTGTDAMAGVLASIDTAATSIGFPIRNMHTISESAHTGDVLAAVHGIEAFVRLAEREGITAQSLRDGHPRLDTSTPLNGSSLREQLRKAKGAASESDADTDRDQDIT